MARDALATYLASAPATINVTDSTTATTQYGVGANAQETIDLHTIIGNKREGGPVLEIQYNTAQVTLGTGTLLFTYDHADDTLGVGVGIDSGTPGTFQILSAATVGAIPLTTTAVAGIARIPIPKSKKYGRLNAIMHGSGATAVIASAQLTQGYNES
ncbi:MAG TPA: hypothetical protein VJQ82_17215 [Terriglobales bacterium]|nr:hypothetical protein [Terriglobales bacterium]